MFAKVSVGLPAGRTFGTRKDEFNPPYIRHDITINPAPRAAAAAASPSPLRLLGLVRVVSTHTHSKRTSRARNVLNLICPFIFGAEEIVCIIYSTRRHDKHTHRVSDFLGALQHTVNTAYNMRRVFVCVRGLQCAM